MRLSLFSMIQPLLSFVWSPRLLDHAIWSIIRWLHDGYAAVLQIAVEPAELLKMLIPVWFHPPYVSYWCNKATVQ